MLILNLDYSKMYCHPVQTMCSTNEAVQHESGPSSVQVRMCGTSKIDSFGTGDATKK